VVGRQRARGSCAALRRHAWTLLLLLLLPLPPHRVCDVDRTMAQSPH